MTHLTYKTAFILGETKDSNIESTRPSFLYQRGRYDA